jgi:hypothetical protein
MVKAEVLPGTVVIAAATLPWVSPEAGTRDNAHFAQIWSNLRRLSRAPTPELRFILMARAKAIWIAAPIETANNEVNGRLITGLLKDALKGPCHFEADTHPSVQLTLFDQPERTSFFSGC